MKKDQNKISIFISYARADAEFADRLVLALEQRNFVVRIDRRDLPYGEEWQDELSEFMRTCDTVIWMVTPTSVSSNWVNWELGEVQRLNKRLVPIMVSVIPPTSLPPAVGKIHILPADRAFDIERDLSTLETVLLTDGDWVKLHSRFADRAAEWKSSGRGKDKLLRGAALKEATRWHQNAPASAPAPTLEILDLLSASQDASRSRLRGMVAASMSLAIALLGLAAFALFQSVQASLARDQAAEQRDVAQLNESNFAAERAFAMLAAGNAFGALNYILPYLPERISEPSRPLSIAALAALRSSLYESNVDLSGTVSRKVGPVKSLIPSPDLKRLVVANDKLLWILDIPSGTVLDTSSAERPFGIGEDARWSADSRYVLSMPSVAFEGVSVYDVAEQKFVSLAVPDCYDQFAKRPAACPIFEGAWHPELPLLATGDRGNSVRVWDIRKQEQIASFEREPCSDEQREARGVDGCSFYQVLWSPDGTYVAGRENDSTLTAWKFETREVWFSVPDVGRLMVDESSGTAFLSDGSVVDWSDPTHPISRPDKDAGNDRAVTEVDDEADSNSFALPPDFGRAESISWNSDRSRVAVLARTSQPDGFGSKALAVIDAASGQMTLRLGTSDYEVLDYLWQDDPDKLFVLKRLNEFETASEFVHKIDLISLGLADQKLLDGARELSAQLSSEN